MAQPLIVCPSCRAEYEAEPAFRFCSRCGSGLGVAGRTSAELAATAPGMSSVDGLTDPWAGRIVDGKYRVLERIGLGGMGSVYRVQHVMMGKVAAMKLLHRELAGDREAVRRFRREAQAVSQLDHPNIVQTFDYGKWEGSPYLVMEYVKGENLGALLEREGPWPFSRAAPMFAEICSALAEAHEAGIIHRDLKPENIVCVTRRQGPHVKVLDFGLAKLREQQGLAEITSRNSLVGTPYYMSPEQVRAEPLDARSDIYSLGATLYRVLTGEPPFQAPSPIGILTKHLTEAPVPPSARMPDLQIPPEADAVVMRAMAKNPSDRFRSVAEVQQHLEQSLRARREPGPAPAAAAEIGPAEGSDRLRREDFDAFERSLRRRKLLVNLILPAVLSGLAAGGWWAARSLAEAGHDQEIEPNSTPATATLLPNRQYVHGTIGKPGPGGEPDLDYFRIPAGPGPRSVKALLDPVPGVDMLMELFDRQGHSLRKVNDAGPGQRELLPPTAVGSGDAYLLVREVWIDGQDPTDNHTDAYSLFVEWN